MRPDTTPQPVIDTLLRFAEQHCIIFPHTFVAAVEWDNLQHRYYFYYQGNYRGVELNGYLHP